MPPIREPDWPSLYWLDSTFQIARLLNELVFNMTFDTQLMDTQELDQIQER
ncbi:MAG: hypothetical protein ACI9UN_004350 [Granulosicoccus sp.]|jgi:hypothetical protein